MRRHFLHIMLLAIVSCTIVSCHKGGEVIPRAKFARLYADMLVADSWLLSSGPEAKKKADSTAFYEPIFRNAGYSTEDYLISVEYYLNDPGRFGRILKKTSAILDSDIKELKAESEKEKKTLESARKTLEHLELFSREIPVYHDLLRSLHVTDRMEMALDSNGVFHPADIVEDTVFSGPRIILRGEDTISVRKKPELLN